MESCKLNIEIEMSMFCDMCNIQTFRGNRTLYFDMQFKYRTVGREEVCLGFEWLVLFNQGFFQFQVFRDFNDGFTDDFSAQVYAEIETTVLEFSDQVQQVNHASCSPINHNHYPKCPKKRRDWQLFSCNGRLEDIRFVIREDESSETLEEKHTTRITQIKSFLDHHAKETKPEYSYVYS